MICLKYQAYNFFDLRFLMIDTPRSVTYLPEKFCFCCCKLDIFFCVFCITKILTFWEGTIK